MNASSRYVVAVVLALGLFVPFAPEPGWSQDSNANKSSDAGKKYAAVFCGSDGITLRWYSNEIETVVDEEADDCRVDNRAGVIWYRDSNADLKMYDRSAGESTTIVKGVPKKVSFGIAYETLHLVPKFGAWLVLVQPAEAGSRVTVKGGRMQDASTLDKEQIRDEMSVVGKEKLEKLGKRAEGATKNAECETGLFAPCTHRSELDDPPDRIEGVPRDPCSHDQCGRTEVVPNTGYLLVTTEYSCGDLCHATKKLYDPSAEKFLDPATGEQFDDPGEAPKWSGGTFSPDGNFLLRGKSILKIGEGTLLELDKGDGAGWLRANAGASTP